MMGQPSNAKYDPDWVREYYAAYGEREWNRWEESPVERVTFLVHREILRQYVEPEDRILEIGAGAGRFTRELATIGCRITVGDLSPAQLALNRENADGYGYGKAVEDWVECDMCHLASHFEAEAFDTVVCYGGPLSYVFDQSPQALREIVRVMRPGGRVLLSVMSLWGSVHQYLGGVLDLEIEINRKIVSSGDLLPETVGEGRHYCHMFRPEELRSLLTKAGLEIERVSASDCLAVGWSERLGEIEEGSDLWDHLIEMELEACRDPGSVGMGSHIIAVCRRP